MPNPTAPKVLALITADYVHRDTRSGKVSLLGTFTTVNQFTFPCVHRDGWLYLAVTNGRKAERFTIRLVDDTDTVVWSGIVEVKMTSPIEVVEVGLPWPNVVFPRPGEYRLQVLHEDEQLYERKIIANQEKRHG